jgi:guanylate kinase
MPGKLFIVSAPSGAGKTTLVRALLNADPAVRLSVSHPTRAMRAGEIAGKHYHFVGAAEFAAMRAAGDFLESATVHGNSYGTSRHWVESCMAEESDILLEIDWQGARQVKSLMHDSVGIFILPPSLEALSQRLSNRATDTPEVIGRRLAAARSEIAHVSEFDYVILNNDFDEATRDLIAVVRAERLRLPNQLTRHGDLINRMK